MADATATVQGTAAASETERNKAVVRRFVEEVQNRKDLDVYDELHGDDFVNHSSFPGVPPDKAGGKMVLGGFFAAFPDLHVEIEDMIAEGDRVATKKTFTGTHEGAFGAIPPSGNRVTLTYVDILRLRDGKIVEHWLSMDQLSLLQQLGAIPAP